MSIFKDCVICFTGSLSLGTRKEVTTMVEKQGATVSSSVTKSTTHLVTNQETVSSQTTAVTKAQDNEIFIVSEQWVTKSINAKKRQDESEYSLVAEGDDEDDEKTTTTAAKKGKASASTSSTSKKRSAPEDDDEEDDEATEEPPKKKGKTTVKVVTKGKYAIAPESGLADESNARIYIDSEGCGYTAMLNQTNISGNNNKFYQIQVIERGSGRFTLYQRWGRVGAFGTIKNDHFNNADKATKAFEKKFKDKTKNNWSDRDDFTPYKGKYTMIEVSYESDDDEENDSNVFSNSGKEKRKKAEAIPSKLDPRVQDVIKLISNIDTMKDTMKEFEIDIEQMPLGKLSKKQIMKGYEILKMIQRKLDGGRSSKDDDDEDDDENEDGYSYRDSLGDLSSRFYTLIPHSFGMRRPPVIDTVAKLQNKIEMLQTLSDMEIAQTLLQSTESMSDVNPIDSAYDSLKTELVPLDKNGEEFKLILDYVKNTHAATHNNYTLDLQDVFTVKRAGEEDRYTNKSKDLHNKRLLWHGSRITNYMGILSQGLRIAPPEAPVTGYMFGKGVYFADMVSKSANYCFAYNSNNTGFMLLSEVALGDMYERLNADGTLPQTLPAKYKSTWGKGLTVPDPAMSKTLNGVEVPIGTPVSSGVRGAVLQYNEFIVYDVAQVNIKYLLKLNFNYRR